jgi:hypothetical protein
MIIFPAFIYLGTMYALYEITGTQIGLLEFFKEGLYVRTEFYCMHVTTTLSELKMQCCPFW